MCVCVCDLCVFMYICNHNLFIGLCSAWRSSEYKWLCTLLSVLNVKIEIMHFSPYKGF